VPDQKTVVSRPFNPGGISQYACVSYDPAFAAATDDALFRGMAPSSTGLVCLSTC
jgi:hypothetical protein